MVFKYVIERIALVGSESLLKRMNCIWVLFECIWIVFLVFLEHDVSHFDESVKLTGDFEWILLVKYLVFIVFFLRQFLLRVEVLVVNERS